MKNTLTIIIVIAALAIGFFLYNKQKNDLSTTTGNAQDEFSYDDTERYNSIRADVSEGQRKWVDPLVATMYNAGKNPAILINGRASKMLTLLTVLGSVNANPKGEFTNPDGTRVLIPQHVFDRWWFNQRAPFLAKWGGL